MITFLFTVVHVKDLFEGGSVYVVAEIELFSLRNEVLSVTAVEIACRLVDALSRFL